MSEIKLVALDMDGTLLNDQQGVTDYNKKVIAKAMEKDVHIVLSTGRYIGSCYPYAQELGLTSPLITVNGGQIFTSDKKLIEETIMDTEKLAKMYYLGNELDVFMWLVSTENVYHNELPIDYAEQKWLKFGCETKDEKKLEYIIKELSYMENLELSNSTPHNIEVNPIGVNKANALKRVCKELGITMDEIMAVGDSLNDIKMIQEAGIGVAMGNAQEAILKAADYVTDINNNHGVGKVIEKFVL